MMGIRKEGSNTPFLVPARDLAQCLGSIISSSLMMSEEALEGSQANLEEIVIDLANVYSLGKENNKKGLKALKDLMERFSEDSEVASTFSYFFMYNTLLHLFTTSDMLVESPTKISDSEKLMSVFVSILNLMDTTDRMKIKKIISEFVPTDFNKAIPECSLLGEKINKLLKKEDPDGKER